MHTTDSVGLGDGVILSRRCVDCEHRETVVISVLEASAWYRRDTLILARMRAQADSIEREIGIPFVPRIGWRA